MSLFKTTDYTFCINKKCRAKENCKRSLEHYPQLKDHKHLSIFIVDFEFKKDCDLYLKIK